MKRKIPSPSRESNPRTPIVLSETIYLKMLEVPVGHGQMLNDFHKKETFVFLAYHIAKPEA
jgi:hypothetical protein